MFSASHISLQQAVHLSPAPHIFSYFLYYPFLRSGQFKRKVLGIEGIEYLPYLIKIQAAIFTLPVFAITQNVELHIKQFFKLQAILCLTK